MCNCMNEMNAALAPHNGKLETGIQITQSMGLKAVYLMATEKIDKAKRKPVPKVSISYCPFCGEKLAGAAEET